MKRRSTRGQIKVPHSFESIIKTKISHLIPLCVKIIIPTTKRERVALSKLDRLLHPQTMGRRNFTKLTWARQHPTRDTRTDGVVRWWQCLESIGDERENIEVRGSHSGLGFNPAVIFAISDRLALAPGDWQPFRAPFGFGHQYPHPADWAPDLSGTVA